MWYSRVDEDKKKTSPGYWRGSRKVPIITIEKQFYERMGKICVTLT